MEQRALGDLFNVSALSLGGGGVGQVWGSTTREETIATVRAAYEAGITLFDMAPLYGRGGAETVLGLSFADGYPSDVRVTTKCMLGTVPAEDVLPRLERSLDKTCERMQRSLIDLFILHGYVVPDGFSGGARADILPRIVVPWTLYREAVVPAMKELVLEGRIGAWGITAAGPLETNLRAVELGSEDRSNAPGAVQCITNLLDSPGGMALDEEVPRPREMISAASAAGLGVMGIRAVAAGSLTDAIDRDFDRKAPEARDYERAGGFRAVAAELGESSASLAHRYALSMPGVDTVVLGVKNREELRQCLDAEAAGPLDREMIERIDSVARGWDRAAPTPG